MTTEKVLYRYSFCDQHGEGDLPNRFDFRLEKFVVGKNTPRGWWILRAHFKGMKFVPSGCKASYAHTTPSRAMEAFIARRQKYHKILVSTIKQNERLLKHAIAHQKECEYETEQERLYREANIVF